MRRSIATFALVLFSAAALGIAGCSASSDPIPEAATVTATVTAAPSEQIEEQGEGEDAVGVETPAAVDLSLAEDCMSLVEPLQKANLAMLEIAEKSTTDPQSAVDTWRAFSIAFEDFGKTAADPVVAALSTAVGEDGYALTDAMEKIYVKADVGAMGEFTEASDAFSKAYQELLSLCQTAA